MRSEELLSPFAFVYIGVVSSAIVFPYLARKTELVTARNLYLLGLIIFLGFSTLYAVVAPEARYAYHTDEEFTLFMLGATLQVAALLAVYHWVRFPRKIGRSLFRQWPPFSTSAAIIAVLIALVVGGASRIAYLPVISEVFRVASPTSLSVACGVAFLAWFRGPNNPVAVALFVLVFGISLLLSVTLGGGRKAILGMLVVVPIILYWLKYRTKSPAYNLALCSIVASVLFVFVVAYSMTRHFDRGKNAEGRNLSTAVTQLSKTAKNMFKVQVGVDLLSMSQDATSVALYAIHYTDDLEPKQPLAFPACVASSVVPRRFYPKKPKNLGVSLARHWQPKWRVNWGANLVCYAFHDGGRTYGLLLVIVYSAFTAAVLRTFDEALLDAPLEPFRLVWFAAASSFLLGWARGDIANITVNLVGLGVLMLMIQLPLRFFFSAGPHDARVQATRARLPRH